MKHGLQLMVLSGSLLCASPVVLAEDTVTAVPQAEQSLLRFTIERYIVEGASLLQQTEINAAVAPYTGKDKDFSDVQRALQAIEEAYVRHGFSAVRVALPEQELDKGTVHFRVVESRFGKVTVVDNRFATEANVLNAVPSVRSGEVPRAKKIARELKLANENPARQLNVVLQASENNEQVDAKVVVTDTKPITWGVSADNSGTPETGRARFGVSYRHANLFGKDHVAGLQYQTSPQHVNRVTVLGGSYKIPLYRSGDSVEFFGGYSNVNSVVGGIDNFQGGGLIFSGRYNHPLEQVGVFEPKLSFGLDLRDFRRIELTTTVPATVLYNEIVVMPVSVSYAAQGKFAQSDLGFNATLAANIPGMNKGKAADFAVHDQVRGTQPNANYRMLRYGVNYAQLIGNDWQFRAVLNGQWSRDVLIAGEQFRLGGADGVRGFTEGSVNGESGMRWNIEGYTPDFGKGDFRTRALMFFDTGQTRVEQGALASISSAGLGLRASYQERFSLRCDAGRVIHTSPGLTERVGNWRVHLSLAATF